MNNQKFIAGIGNPGASLFLRRIVGYGAIAAAIPYLLLKINWLTGGTTGMNDPAFFANPTYLVANAVTFAMDALAILLALTLTEQWGNRVPPLLILFPVWMATGLLLPIIFILLFSPLAQAAPEAAKAGGGDGALQAWVFAMVYGCFAAQGTLLSAAFALYVRRRWQWIFVEASADEMPNAVRGLERVLLVAATAISVLVGACYACWAAGVNVGALSASHNGKSGIFYVASGVHAAFAFVAAIGSALLLRYVSSRRAASLWLPLALVWAGSAALFAWGAWELFVSLGMNTDLSSPAANFLRTVKMGVSLLLIVTTAFITDERATRLESSELFRD